jgi:hypothetical protein
MKRLDTNHPEASRASRSGLLDRRGFLVGVAASWLVVGWPLRSSRADAGSSSIDRAGDPDLERALAESRLVYVSPLRKDGHETACHGEVWFVTEGSDVLVVTAADRWRATAIRRGLDRARLWVGDHGVWKRAARAWETSPSMDARARLDGDREAHARALALFGEKYASEWKKWGPRFEEGLASGERVLVRYTPVSTG